MEDIPVSKGAITPNKAEITSSDSPYYLPSQFRPYNPDKLYRKKGNYDIYDDMREDDAIKSILMTKKYLMLGSGWTIDLIDEDDEQQQEIRDFIKKCLTEDIEIDFNKSMLEILTCMDYGVSFSEIVWHLKDGQYKIKYIKTRAPHPFKIYTDKKGNITKLQQDQELTGCVDIDKLDNIIVMPFQMEFDNWYGKSDLKSAYRAWWSKDFIIKAWNIYLDRFGMPLAVGKFDSTATQEDQNKIQQILSRLQTKTSITIPKEFELEFLEATRAGEAGYEAALNNYNLQIARSMLMPDLMGMAGDKTAGGSFALGQTQYDMFLKTLEWTRLELQRKIQRKIIDNLVKYNFSVEDIPQFKFKAMSESVKTESLKTWIELQKAGVYKPSDEEINWGRRIIGAPEGDVEQPDPPPAPIMPVEKLDEDGKPIKGKQDGTGMAGKPKDGKPLDGTKPTDKKGNKDIVEKKMVKEIMRKSVMAEKKQDFSMIKQDQINTEETYSKQASATIATMQESLLQTIKKGRYIENQKLDKVNSLELKFTDRLRMDIKTGAREIFKLGKRDALALLNKKEYALDEEDIYDQVVKENPKLAALSISDDILKNVKITLTNGISQGLSQSAIIGQIKQIFEPYIVAYDGAKLDTIIRTNYATVYNQSKMAYFEPAKTDGTIYAYQYSAVMDGRTTDICGSLDQKIFKADNVGDIEPPLHFNCRSTLIPILKDEIENKEIFGATPEQNADFFPKDKFKESKKDLSGYEMRPGGFFVKKSNLTNLTKAELIKEYELKVETDLFDNYWRVTKKSSVEFMEGTLSMQEINGREGIFAMNGKIKGNGGTAVQAYLFTKDNWKEDDILKWILLSEKQNKPADIDYMKVIT